MRFRFGEFELDEETRELRKQGQAVAIQPKPLALLFLLAREHKRVVPTDELLDALWPGTVVTQSSLTRAVSLARKAIDDTHKGSILKSVARRGYRFDANVVEVPTAAAPSEGVPHEGGEGVPFVGRTEALEGLREAWASAMTGRGSLALVTGAAGIGKTRLTEVFGAEVSAHGALVLEGRCRDDDGAPAFWLWTQILRQLIEDESLGELVREGGAKLAGLAPELSDRSVSPKLSDSEHDRFLLFDAFARALIRCAARRPLVLILEDLQWARSPSLRLLEHLVFEISAASILVIATVRDAPRERGDPLNKTLGILRGRDRCVQIPLESFSRGEVAALVERVIGSRPPADLSSELFVRTEGVPLFLREAIRLLGERGDLQHPERIPQRGITLPSHALDLIRRALDTLSEPCAELIAAAAVLGREFSLPLVASVAECDRAEALDLLDEAAHAGVVEVLPGSTAHFRFTHALHQEAMVESLPTGTRARLHGRAAARLEAQHADDLEPVIAELAHHHHQGLAVGDANRAYEVCLRAAERASQLLAYEQAATHYEQALLALDHQETMDPLKRLDTLLGLGESYRRAGDRSGRREVFGKAMQAARSLGEGSAFARAAIGFCELSEWGVRDDEARAALEEALAGLDPSLAVERARLLTRLSYLTAFVSRERAEKIARQAVEQASGLDDPDALQDALYILHLNLGHPDDLEERGSLLEGIQSASKRAITRDPAVITAIDVACDRLSVGDPIEARRLREEAERVATQDSHLVMFWHLQVYDTGLALLEGRFDEVEERARSMLQLGQRIEHPFAPPVYAGHRAALAIERGDRQFVLDLFEPTLLAGQSRIHWVDVVVARTRNALGREEEARLAFEDLAAEGFEDIPRNLRWMGTMVEIAQLCADLGDAERASLLRDLLTPYEHHHGVFPTAVLYGGPVTRCLARLLETLERRDEALELYEEALESSIAIGARPMLARVQLELGRLLGKRGTAKRARDLIQASATLAAELGMEELRAQAEAAL